ncbi:MAG TPA: tetratricopeptide repeat protein [Candidatus Binataceae bacterium]|nr:tetratricopeptide repeat protein [Candidatus Binataceae bacterium]
MDATTQKFRAIELWREAYQHHTRAFALAGGQCDHEAVDELNTAVRLYSQSIELYPTAEAYTFRGWAYCHFGRIDDAIAECKRAIEVDPEFGNPYNDIGAYLINKGELDEAIDWLEKAKRASRYEPRHFPYMNLGRLYAQKGMVVKAIAEFEEALRLAQTEGCGDGNAAASIGEQLRGLRAMLN